MATAKDKSINRRAHTSLPVIAGSSLAGTAVEWYDFFLYGTAAALVFNKLFFPSEDPLVGTMLAFATYAVGFVARPLGAAVLGHFGDVKGRRATLIASLLLMGVSTFLIALLPTYAAIGVTAPLLLVLLRLVQGFALGGEWGGAVLLVSEHGDSKRRAFWSAWPNLGPPLGNLMAAGALALLGAVLPEEAFLSWGWRVAFGMSALLVVIGLVLRLYVAETPLFEQTRAATSPAVLRMPLTAAVRGYWRQILLAAFTRFGENAGFYIFSLFVITYLTQILDLPRSTGLNAVMIGMVVALVAIPLFAVLADRIGRRPIYIGASIATIVWAFAFFALLDTEATGAIFLAVAVGLVIFAAYSAVIGAFFSELFPTEVRYSGVSLAYNLASVLAGSLAPIIAIALYDRFGSGQAIGAYLALMGVISLVAALVAKETRTVDLADVQEEAPATGTATDAAVVIP
ncbi:MHS family MFS transporter [Nocardia farcinica]|uniref:Putative proline/betaine transporter n=1 Tax=Nocardia farcinica (strain IFM 10152) TaxID=247156 RepID=Q5YY12_NOCFA|nr:MFS transporter [Nocardia farcinica]MBF6261466.1 MHS family MFS transporter [Nocardia farcinica]MBF6267842.1 MHS family MFS transporter [Nocardia farcinica]MBF6278865.1 MHS family MFS transporter [Nocardia farcinica]MBF6304477.1 MHS family MFS transporter [Nocardia farcinica]MBF6389518.1 MHS family MFS transporter [Nocardia farcinica]